MVARITRPAKSAMQSGLANTKQWVLEFEPEAARGVEPLMGWTSSSDMNSQVRLEFDTKEEAIAYAEKNGLPYSVSEPRVRKHQAKSYTDNFRYGRIERWTH
ncbi:MAG: ETC complex I subunit [Hyphomicrobiaceae bacterium]|nr:ETC complex I subunit [Hyphomicrobiaceae bacterium]MCC0010165.1 ETC complex I subunit [Hyphomicrobiaceae bacterium]